MIDQKLDLILQKLEAIQSTQESMEKRLNAIESHTADIPLIRRAVLETNETVKQIDTTQKTFERKASADLNTHDHGIDILNRRQFKLEAEVERLKNR